MTPVFSLNSRSGLLRALLRLPLRLDRLKKLLLRRLQLGDLAGEIVQGRGFVHDAQELSRLHLIAHVQFPIFPLLSDHEQLAGRQRGRLPSSGRKTFAPVGSSDAHHFSGATLSGFFWSFLSLDLDGQEADLHLRPCPSPRPSRPAECRCRRERAARPPRPEPSRKPWRRRLCRRPAARPPRPSGRRRGEDVSTPPRSRPPPSPRGSPPASSFSTGTSFSALLGSRPRPERRRPRRPPFPPRTAAPPSGSRGPAPPATAAAAVRSAASTASAAADSARPRRVSRPRSSSRAAATARTPSPWDSPVPAPPRRASGPGSNRG